MKTWLEEPENIQLDGKTLRYGWRVVLEPETDREADECKHVMLKLEQVGAKEHEAPDGSPKVIFVLNSCPEKWRRTYRPNVSGTYVKFKVDLGCLNTEPSLKKGRTVWVGDLGETDKAQ